MLFVEVVYKFQRGIDLGLYEITSFSGGYITYNINGRSYSNYRLVDFLDSDEFRLKYAKGKVTDTGLVIHIITSEDNISLLCSFINNVCDSALQEHINKCITSSKDFDMKVLQNRVTSFSI